MMAIFISLLSWLFPVFFGAGLAFVVHVFRRTRFPARKNALDLIIALIIGYILGGIFEGMVVYALGQEYLKSLVGAT